VQKIVAGGGANPQNHFGLRQRCCAVARYLGSSFFISLVGNVYGFADPALNLDTCAELNQFAGLSREQRDSGFRGIDFSGDE